MERYLRFARALALAAAAPSAGCDGGALFAPDATSHQDGDAIDDGAHDAIADATHDAADADVRGWGSCRVIAVDSARDMPCPEGFACSFPDDADTPRCTFGYDAAGALGDNMECGVITCSEYCYCAGPAASVCGCFHGPSGPLSPPDLPRARVRRNARPLRALRPSPRARHRGL
jgi:hypothetical protein